MGSDISRIRLNPFLDFAGVELKQGGVLIDADANELMGIVDRRLRALASDVLGRATVSSTTPDAFKIGLAGSALTIGKGRLYVDGLLAENHGAKSTDNTKWLFDPLMAEPVFADAIAYPAQPYLPAPPALPASGRHLVYLDVWNRDVTHLEDPDLVENAIGVETTSRIQTVWQVRVLPENAGSDVTCASPDADVPGWASLTAASTGVLTTDEYEVTAADDPCELPPTGGYRGLENQLYRVEIHDGGQPGAGATFKWSRENASVGSRVTNVVASGEMELASLGRDDVLSFKTGDWVEITDNAREFSQAPGEIRKITVFEATRRIQFSPPLPAAMLPAAFPSSTFPDERSMRVRRWDQGSRIFRTNGNNPPVQVQDLDAPGATGVIAVPASSVTLILEHGITVSFASTGSKGFKPGDYWVFAARTADASVEKLTRARPRGIHHHFARLALWDIAAGTVTDCRHPWPPEAGEGHDCSCTACVTAQSHADGSFTIQDAVNQASQTGGTVCIGTGQFALREPVRLTGTRSLRIRGQGAATVVISDGCAFALKTCIAVGIENLAIISIGRQPAISVNTALGLKLRELLIAVLRITDFQGAAIALQGIVAGSAITDNGIFAPFGIRANDSTAPRDEGQNEDSYLLAGALAITDNFLWCSEQAITLDGRVLHIADTRITGNDVVACSQTAISTLGMAVPSAATTICNNNLYVTQGGIQSSLEGLWISENKLVNTSRGNDATAIEVAGGLSKNGTGLCQILANQISSFGGTGISIAAPVRDLIIKLNIIEECGNGILTTGGAIIGMASIENNHLRNIGMGTGDESPVTIGIGVSRAGTVDVSGNKIRSLGTRSIRSPLRTGIVAFGVARARLSGNDIAGLGPSSDFIGPVNGIMVLAPLGDFTVDHCNVERDISQGEGGGVGDCIALLVRGFAAGGATATVGGFTTANTGAAGLVLIAHGKAFLAAARDTGARASILGNMFSSRGDAPAVDIAAAECQFNDNRVEARLNSKDAVTIATPVIVMNANRVLGGERSVFVSLATAKSAAILGNITTGVISLDGGALPPPWSALNLRF